LKRRNRKRGKEDVKVDKQWGLEEHRGKTERERKRERAGKPLAGRRKTTATTRRLLKKRIERESSTS
jgi:hypothetical protein